MVAAARWATQIISISAEMVVPAVAGHFLDGYLGTQALFTLLGVALGMVVALWHLIGLVRSLSARTSKRDPNSPS